MTHQKEDWLVGLYINGPGNFIKAMSSRSLYLITKTRLYSFDPT